MESPMAAHEARIRARLDVIDDIRRLGLDQDMPIPQVAVVGDQSSGKSSVLEALSGIPFPRGSGTVTRCATVLSMKPSADFNARVSLRLSPDSESPPQSAMPDLPIFASSFEEVGAGIAVVSQALIEAISTPFSKHSIEVQLQAPSAPHLTLVDLPGIVRTATDEISTSDIPFVDDLLNHHITMPRTVILAVIPANVDIATVDILERASKVDQLMERTLGVLTKCDLINPGGEEEVIQVLLNRKKKLRLGYLALRNKTQTELTEESSNGESARRVEKHFFASHPHFSKVEARLLGAESLASRLTEILVAAIETALPPIMADVRDQLMDAKKELKGMGEKLPQTHGGLRAVFQRALDQKMKLIEKVAVQENTATNNVKTLWGACRAAFDNLDQTLQKFQPGSDLGPRRLKVVVKERKEPHCSSQRDADEGSEVEIILKEWENKEEFFVGQDLTLWDVSFDEQECESCRNKSHVRKYDILGVICPLRIRLAEQMSKCRGREFPGFLNFNLFAGVFGEYVKMWRAPAMRCLETIISALSRECQSLLQDKVGTESHRFPSMINQFLGRSQESIDNLQIKCEQQIEIAIEEEKTPFTQPQNLVAALNGIRLARLDRAMNRIKKIETDEAELVRTLYTDAVHAWYKQYHAIDTEHDSSVQGSKISPSSVEVGDMIDLLHEYWGLARTRFVDRVAMALDRILVREFPEYLKERIMEAGENDELMAVMMHEDPAVASRREYLEDKVQRLEQAQRRLR